MQNFVTLKNIFLIIIIIRTNEKGKVNYNDNEFERINKREDK